MPELTVKEVRLPELHLPELKRDEIVRALSEIRVPTGDLPKKVDLALPDRPRLDLSRIDVGKAVAGALVAIRRVAMPARRPRWPIAIGILAVLGLVAVALVRTPAGREATERATRLARERVDAVRASLEDATDGTATGSIEASEPAAIDPRMSDVAAVMTSEEDALATTTTPV